MFIHVKRHFQKRTAMNASLSGDSEKLSDQYSSWYYQIIFGLANIRKKSHRCNGDIAFIAT